MREILFRGKRLDNGEWVEGYYGQFHNRPVVDKPNSHQIFEPKENARMFGSVIGGLWHIVDPATVGQFTGLTDKNGKRIFEGDIVNIHDTTDFDMTGVVEYYDFGFELHDKENDCYECLWYEPTVVTVLGNIHDNQELLEG